MPDRKSAGLPAKMEQDFANIEIDAIFAPRKAEKFPLCFWIRRYF
jgi:hypothetical protein